MLSPCICMFFKNLYKYIRSLGERCVACRFPVQIYLKSPNIFRGFCQPFHNPINNNLLVGENVGANRPNQICLFLQSYMYISRLGPSVLFKGLKI